MAAVLRSLTLLGLTGASAALCLQEVLGTWLSGFVLSNTLSIQNRHHLIIGMVIGAVAAMLVGVVVWWSDERRLRRLAHLLTPGILLGLLPPVTMVTWTNHLNLGIAIAAVVLLGERLLRVAFVEAGQPALAYGPDGPGRLSRAATAVWEGIAASWSLLFRPRVRRWLPVAIVIAATLGYAIYFTVFTLRMHGRFQTYGFDLGQYDNIFWSCLHGFPMRDTPLHFDKNWEQLRGHAELTVFFFLPVYAIRPNASTLLVLQSAMIALGAIPLYRFVRRRLPRAYAAVFAVAYLMYPPTHGLQFYDIHFQPIAMPLVLWVIDLVDCRRYWWCLPVFILALGCREDISVGLAIMATFMILSGYRVRAGFVMAASATVYFIVMRFIIMPSFGSFGFEGAYKDLQPSGDPTFGGIIATLISNPMFTLMSLFTSDKLRFALQILLPLAFLPVRRAALAVSMIPGAIFTLLTTGYSPTIDIGFQYSAHFPPYIFPAAALAIAAYRGRGVVAVAHRRAALWALIGGTTLAGVHWGAIPPRSAVHGGFIMLPMRAPTPAEIQKDRDIRDLDKLVPKDKSLAVSEGEMPHLSRQWVRTLRDTYDADYILYGVDTGYLGGSNAQRALASGDYETIAERPGLALLRRKSTTQPLPGAKPPAPAPSPGGTPLTTPPPAAVPPTTAPPPAGPSPGGRLPGLPPPRGLAPKPGITPPAVTPPQPDQLRLPRQLP